MVVFASKLFVMNAWINYLLLYVTEYLFCAHSIYHFWSCKYALTSVHRYQYGNFYVVVLCLYLHNYNLCLYLIIFLNNYRSTPGDILSFFHFLFYKSLLTYNYLRLHGMTSKRSSEHRQWQMKSNSERNTDY